ncbi:MAG: hypothetical protein A2017_06925 [Lentisphaerae bacterium GWF2_44_16]|nr:MAG: hypothetical protein A2017_06925 [Lentisphaerae bacterium GWF2_44_16]
MSLHDHQPTHEDFLKAQRISIKDIKEHVTGPVVSVVFHIIVISLLGSIIVFKAPQEKHDIAVEMSEVDLKEIDKIPEPPLPPEDVIEEVKIEIERPQLQQTAVNVAAENISVSESALTIALPDLSSVNPGNAAINSALKLPDSYAMRSNAESRLKALRTYGGDSRNEIAVTKGLDWLMANQNEDGSWGIFQGSKYAFTALATLSFLAHGETPQSQKYGPTLIKAIKMLTKWSDDQVKNGRYIGSGGSYDHAIVAYALAESYGITKIPKIKDAMNKCMKIVISYMNSMGSYYYWYDRMPRIHNRDAITGRMPKGYKPEPPCDLSFAGWNYQALKAAFSAGCDLPGLQDAIDKAVEGLRQHHYNKKEEGFGITGALAKPDFGMTSVGILCLGLFGEGESREAQGAFKWLRKNNSEGLANCSWKYNKAVHDKYQKAFTYALYTWYYQTQVLFQATKGRGGVWKRWNDSFSKALISEQEKDGSWLSPAEKYGSHLDPSKTVAEWSKIPAFKETKDLKIYATTICVLTLEVYYRYLPTYKLIKSVTKGKTTSEEDELGLKIE